MGTPATPPPELTRDEAEGELRRLGEENERMAAALLALDSHHGHQLLSGSQLTGVTLERWTSTQAVIAALWERFALYRRVLEDAGQVWSRRSRPGPKELAELSELFYGLAIERSREMLPLAQRSLTGPAERTERISLVELVRGMREDYARASQVVAAVDRVWSTVTPRLDNVEQRVASLRELAAAIGEEAALGSVDRELAQLRRLVLFDPLSMGGEDGVRTDRLDRVDARLDALRERLDGLARLREEYQDRVSRVRERLADIEVTQERARQARTEVLAKIVVSVLPAVGELVGGLRGRVAGLDALWAQRRWRRLSEELADVEGAVTAAGNVARQTLETFTGLLDRHAELRGRLEAYRAKAAGLGRGEDPELTRYHRAARDLLRTSPCDLREATRAVARYQQAVLGRTSEPSPRQGHPDHPEESS